MPAPQITDITPLNVTASDGASHDGGTLITITGVNLRKVACVQFTSGANVAFAAKPEVINHTGTRWARMLEPTATQIQCHVPFGALNGKIRVAGADGVSPYSAKSLVVS